MPQTKSPLSSSEHDTSAATLQAGEKVGKFYGRGSIPNTGYVIEVRTSYHQPTVLEDFVIDNNWRRLPIMEGASAWGTNIPIHRSDRHMLEQGLLSYEVAQAHRWAFLSYLNALKIGGALCIETRLVKVSHTYTYATEEIGVGESHPSASYERDIAAFTPRSD